VALVLKTRCLFKCVADGVVLGEMSLLGTPLCKDDKGEENGCSIGGFFLRGEEWNACAPDNGIVVRSLVLWSSSGAAAVYRVVVGTSSFESEAVCEIPDILSMQGEGSEIKFCQLNQHLVRVESCSYKVAGSLLWKPKISLWSLDQLELGISENKLPSSKLLREGGVQVEEFRPEPSHSHSDINSGVEMNSQVCSSDSNNLERYGRTVSSSMVLSEDSYAPYAVVYGFHNGDIEFI